MAGPRQQSLRARVIAVLSLCAFLATPFLDAHAASAAHHAGHGGVTSAIDHGELPAMPCAGESGEDLAAGAPDGGCCHASMCSAGVVPPEASPSGFGSARDPAGPVEISLLRGLAHVPPLRPPR